MLKTCWNQLFVCSTVFFFFFTAIPTRVVFKINESLEKIAAWMKENNLELTFQKTKL